MEKLSFTPLEETISFYTRNDFAILNCLLTENYEELWKNALLAYYDNQGIIDEYASGERIVESDYDVKWLSCLKKRIITELDEKTKAVILKNAKDDIKNILGAMQPARENMQLCRTAWIDDRYTRSGEIAYSREYRSMSFDVGNTLEIKIISSCSVAPYREDEDVGSDFYRYEVAVPGGLPVLELDRFPTHNEDGEVLLPPMKCRVTGVRSSPTPRCRGIVEIEYFEALNPDKLNF